MSNLVERTDVRCAAMGLLLAATGCPQKHDTSSSAPPPSAATADFTASATAPASASAPPASQLPVKPVEPAMVLLPKGTFQMGSGGLTGDEMGWSHRESVPSFYLDVTEVTVDAYRKCVSAGACSHQKRDAKCNMERAGYENDPVNCVTWQEAVNYCAWRKAELPTEAMWEYAAGGRRGWDSPWDPKLDAKRDPKRDRFAVKGGRCKDQVLSDDALLPRRQQYGSETTCPVGSLPKGDSPEGIKDLEGNVSEWTSSVYCRLPGKKCEQGERVIKGSAYDNIGYGPWAGIYMRINFVTDRWDPRLGFRCARLAAADAGADGG